MPLPALFLILLGLAAATSFFTGFVTGLEGAALHASGAVMILLGVMWWRFGKIRARRASRRR